VSLSVTLSRVCVSECPLTARRISLSGEGNALYPVSLVKFVASCVKF